MRIRLLNSGILFMLFAFAVCISCNNQQSDKQTIFANNGYFNVALIDTQLNKSTDDAERVYSSGAPFVYFHATQSLDTVRTAFVFYNTNDSTASVRWYRFLNGKWMLKDSISNLPGGSRPVNAVFQDFNFDGQRDIYLQEAMVSENGLGYGLLFTIDPKTKQLTEQPVFRDMGDMSADAATKSIISITLKALGHDLPPAKCTVISQWENGQLKTTSRLCDSD
ncbi:hypothetical protein HHL16_14155 [Pseudoflavitalea sp. G-6-1-2]|uniref:XAC2610-related protein n=1 Tax=Pseudoflavitalea sp. G-6-1-2 TaxID=2728841 RepID=UPI00146D1265|nr:hypothetical protein [Pseudoflavitalea sp. G-6-1-2]NML22026.1 hypothetical protein [Pseudoflavitalea sp. G-6-1-2]